MTGKIMSLSSRSASGFITAEDGLIVGYGPAAVLAYDLPSLAVGQLVSFDLEGGRCPKALNVCVQRAPQVLGGQGKRLEITRIRYMGFEQAGSMRSYRFERLTPGEQKARFSVNADLGLFVKHHVGIQEGPALCLHLLEKELDVAGVAARTSFQYSLTDREMLAHLASRPVPRTKPGWRRAAAASAAASHLV
jgi:hypothetical protein